MSNYIVEWHKNVQGLAWEFHQIDLFFISHDFTSFLAFCVRKRKLNEKRTKRKKTWISLEWHKKGPRFSMRIEEGHGIYIEMYLLTKLAKKKLVSVYLYWRIRYMKSDFRVTLTAENWHTARWTRLFFIYFYQIFGIFDNFSKFRNTFGVFYFEKSSNTA